MPLSDTKLRSLKPRAAPYQIADGGGLFVEVMPGGKKVWRLRYRLAGKQEKLTIGEYPAIPLGEARQRRENSKAMIEHGESPMRAKADAKRQARTPGTVEEFGRLWLDEVVAKSTKNPHNVRRALVKDVFSSMGRKRLEEITQADVLAMTDKIKARGSDQMALQTRNFLKRLFAFAIARGRVTFNPAAAVEARFIATARSRDVALTGEELGALLRGIYTSSLRRANKLALHLLIITMLRKGEVVQARWEEIDLEAGEWTIPGKRMKQGKAHVVYLSRQGIEMLEELKGLSSKSAYVLPSRNTLQKPISLTTLNSAVRAIELEIRDFVLHDFRRTASTHLHEAGFNSDVIEKCLAHEQGGVRGVYNKAQYREQRKRVMQWWANFVDTQIEERPNVVLGRFGKKVS